MADQKQKEEFKALIKPLIAKATDFGQADSRRARAQLAKALELPLRQGVFAGNIIDGIFERVDLEYGKNLEYPLDFVAPGTEKDYRAYTIPRTSQLPDLHVNGDYVSIPTYEVGATISVSMQYLRDAGWFVLPRLMHVLESMIVDKKNQDGWHTILAACTDRNILVYDSAANSGQLTKRLVSLMKTVVRRNGGGNSTSVSRGMLTDLFVSPEAQEDMRNWGVDIIDEITRREIFLADDNSDRINRIFGVNLHALDELGEGQLFQNYFLNELGGSLNANDLELVVGLDLANNDAFLMPVRADVEVVENEKLAELRALGYAALCEIGFACLDNRRCIIGSL